MRGLAEYFRKHRSRVFIFLPVVLVAAGILAYMPYYTITSASGKLVKKELPIYCVGTEEKKVALSFDAAWGNEDTQTLLDILAAYDVHVTFFMTGGWIESYPDDVKAILAAGHDLGNHSENHKQMSRLDGGKCIEELMGPHKNLRVIICVCSGRRMAIIMIILLSRPKTVVIIRYNGRWTVWTGKITALIIL